MEGDAAKTSVARLQRQCRQLLERTVAAIPGGVARPGQLTMAESVAAALHSDEHLLVQAGTGTGKSVAYLVPALASGKTVVVSTATLALQSQLVDVDIPRVLDACAPLLDRRPEVALLKGRGNYLCQLRLADGADGADGGEELPMPGGASGRSRLEAEVARLRSWAQETTTGDRADLEPAVSDRAWRLVSVSARDCVGADRCPHADSCFSEAARDKARAADLVVTNHALLTLDVAIGGRLLPEHDAVVVDEAHELAAKMSDAAAAELTIGQLERIARRCAGALDKPDATRIEEATGGLTSWLRQAPAGRLTSLPASLRAALSVLEAAARHGSGQLEQLAGADPPEAGARQLQAFLDSASEICQRVLADSDADVVWVEAAADGANPLLRVAPLEVASILAEGLFATRTVVATSATLTIGGDFTLLADQLGLTSLPDLAWRGVDVGSPFDYGRQAILYVAGHLPGPAPGSPSQQMLAELAGLVHAAGGRTLALFSSMRGAREAATALRGELSVPVLLQGDAPLPQLVRQFRERAETCLFGTLSLWQGVDVPGPACQLVVIDRIPFPRPDEPLSSARAEAADQAGGNGFTTVSLAHAAVLLAQAAGRLIRSSEDRGVVAVLDSRMLTRRYGALLYASLPPMWRTSDATVARAALRRLDAAAPPSVAVSSTPGTDSTLVAR